MKVNKVINNNVVSAVDQDGTEVVIMGRGVGYHMRKDMEIPNEKIEKIFRLDNPGTMTKFRSLLAQIPLEQVVLQPVQVRTIRDTVATPRLDAVLAAGFSVSRGRAAGLISTGKVSLNHRVCQKTDRQVAQGDVLTCRGLGKCVVKEVPGQSKKGRTVLVLERYV